MAECWAGQQVLSAAKASATGRLKRQMPHRHNDYPLSCMTCANDQDWHGNDTAGVEGDACKRENDHPGDTSTPRRI